MFPKKIILSSKARRQIKKLQKNEQKTVIKQLEKFGAGKSGTDIEKIKANPKFFRLKFRNFRVIYYPHSDDEIVILLILKRNEDTYKNFGPLNQLLETALSKLKLEKK